MRLFNRIHKLNSRFVDARLFVVVIRWHKINCLLCYYYYYYFYYVFNSFLGKIRFIWCTTEQNAKILSTNWRWNVSILKTANRRRNATKKNVRLLLCVCLSMCVLCAVCVRTHNQTMFGSNSKCDVRMGKFDFKASAYVLDDVRCAMRMMLIVDCCCYCCSNGWMTMMSYTNTIDFQFQPRNISN